jgi:mannose-6-phosphate isomerase-like protein (cupin superfamily)
MFAWNNTAVCNLGSYYSRGRMKSIFVTILLFVCSTVSQANEKLGNREVLLDNSDVEVVRLTYPVGAESGMHTHIHPNRVVYFVKGGTLEIVPKDKMEKPKILDVPDGKTLFFPTTTHNIKNIGNTEIVIVETEIKSR